MWRPECNEFTNCTYRMFTEGFSVELKVVIVAAVHKSCSDSTRPAQHHVGVKRRVQAARSPPPYEHCPRRGTTHSFHTRGARVHARRSSCDEISFCHDVHAGPQDASSPAEASAAAPTLVRGWCFPQGYARRRGATHPGRWRERGCHVTDDTKSCSSFVPLFVPCLLAATY